METFWSLALFVALTAGTVGTFAGGVAVMERRTHDRRWWRPAATGLAGAVVAAMFGTASLIVHLRFGHGPDSATPMRLPEFVVGHPSYLAVAVLMVLAAAGWAIATFRSRDGRT